MEDLRRFSLSSLALNPTVFTIEKERESLLVLQEQEKKKDKRERRRRKEKKRKKVDQACLLGSSKSISLVHCLHFQGKFAKPSSCIFLSLKIKHAMIC